VRPLVCLVPLAGLLLSSCRLTESPEQRHRDANTVAGKLGQAAHKVAVQADHASKVVGRKLEKAAHDAHEGWVEAGRDQGKK